MLPLSYRACEVSLPLGPALTDSVMGVTLQVALLRATLRFGLAVIARNIVTKQSLFPAGSAYGTLHIANAKYKLQLSSAGT